MSATVNDYSIYAFGDDNEVNPASFDEIIDDHMEELLDDFEDANCDKSVDDDLVDWLDDNVILRDKIDIFNLSYPPINFFILQ